MFQANELISETIRGMYMSRIEEDSNIKIEKSQVLQPQNTCDISAILNPA